jgi:hypothetical protein
VQGYLLGRPGAVLDSTVPPILFHASPIKG